MSNLANSINGKFFTYISPSINLKSTGNTTIFTTQFGLTFIPLDLTMLCDTATAANGNGVYNVGTNSANFDNWISGGAFTANVANNFSVEPRVGGVIPIFPVTTAVVFRLTSADTGTAITGRVIVTGFYIQ